MGRQNFNIPDKKYDQVIELIIAGESTIQTIADSVGIDWKTAKRIYVDPDTHEMISQNASNKFKNSMDAMSGILLDIARHSKMDGIRLEAAKHALALAGMSPTTKQEIKTELTNTGALNDVLDQIKSHNASNNPTSSNTPTTSSNSSPDEAKADDD